MSSPTAAFWVVGAVLTAALAAFLVVAAMCFRRRNAFHEERKQVCLQAMRRNVAAGDRGGITSGHRVKKNGRKPMAVFRISPSAPPSPAAAAIPVLVAGPHHYYTDPTTYTYESFYAATNPYKANHESVEVSTQLSSASLPSSEKTVSSQSRAGEQERLSQKWRDEPNFKGGQGDFGSNIPHTKATRGAPVDGRKCPVGAGGGD